MKLFSWILPLLLQRVCSEPFTSYINFEKYYLIEEELIALADLIIQQEKIIHENDVHEFLNITHIIEENKAIHSLYSEDAENYLSHPVNTFKLSRRLAWEWKNVIYQVMETDTCVKNLKVKLQNIEDNLPTEKQMSQIAMSMINLQKFANMSVPEVVAGEIDGHSPLAPLSLDDVIYIAKTGYDEELFYYAITWLNYVIEKIEKKKIKNLEGKFTKEKMFSLLGSAYFKMNYIDKALDITDQILDFDPENSNARRNKEYYKSIIQPGKAKEITEPVAKKKSLRLYNEICRSDIQQIISKDRCLYFPLRNKSSYMKSTIKAEIIKNKPLIIYFHEFIDNKTATALKTMGHEKLSQLTSLNRYSYPRHSSGIDDWTKWKWIPKLEEKFKSLHLSNLETRNSKFNVMNVGLDGFIRKKQDRVIYPVGEFIVGLTEDAVGGDIVFPLSKTKFHLKKGDVIFYEYSALFTICPVIYGEAWYGTQFLFEVAYPKDISPPKRLVKRGY